ncbi:MAG: Na/Pi cotransporter family protein, partial [Opitutaceae bacterium]
MVLLNIAGGVALILFGIRFLRKGLDRLLGHGLHGWLERMAQRPAKAAVAGFAFGTIAPS